MEETVQEAFKSFLMRKEKEAENISPMMGLALKIDTNLSHRQYIKLSSAKILGKLPGMARVRKAGSLLDPGNVDYLVVSKNTGEIVRMHGAIPESGLCDADDDLGHLSFGDLNVNVHGFRATLYDTIAKLLEETYPDILKELEKNPGALADQERKMVAHIKVCFDGTNAPLRSDKGASRLSVANWLRCTVCLVAVQVKNTNS